MVHNNTIWQCHLDVHLFPLVPLESTHNNRLGRRKKKGQISFGASVKSQKMTEGWKNRAKTLKGGTGAEGWSVLIIRSKSDAWSRVSVICADPGHHKHLFLRCFAFKLNPRWFRWCVENPGEDPVCVIHHVFLLVAAVVHRETSLNQSDLAA